MQTKKQGKITIMENIRGNTAEIVRNRILDELQSGQFDFSDRLVTDSLAKRYNVSRTPVREALIRLEQEGIVAATANSGFELRQPTIPELCELYELRELLEGVAVEKVTRNGASPDFIARLRTLCEERRTSMPDSDEKAGRADRDFHQLICDSCDSPLIQSLIRNYLALSKIFRANTSLPKRKIRVRRDADREHDRIVDAIEAGNAKLARKLMSNHIASARRDFERLLNKTGNTSKSRS